MPAYDDDDVLVKKETNPVTTTLLIISAVALVLAIWISSKELGLYVNPETSGQLREFTVPAVQHAEGEIRELRRSAIGLEDDDQQDL